MGRFLVHWMLGVVVGLGLSVLGAIWLADHGTNGLLSRSILGAQAFSLGRWQVWLAIGALVLWKNHRKVGPMFQRQSRRIADHSAR